MKEIINKDGTKIFEKEAVKKDFSYFTSFLQNGYNFADVSPNRPEGFFAEDALTVLAVNSGSLADFENNLSAFVPYRAISAYLRVKDATYPTFLKLVWTASTKGQEKQLNETTALIKKTGFIKWLGKARSFYKSDYPENLPLKVGLVPIPDYSVKKKHTSALNLRDVQVVPYLLSKGLRDSLDVVFHEFCHALYEGQSSSTMKLIDKLYLGNKSSHSLFVYRYINEALATAWGNGWYKEILDGKLSQKSWYAVGYIDDLAKAYLPLIKQYVSKKRSIDSDFVQKTIEIAKEKFPNADREIHQNFMAIRVLVDHKTLSSKTAKKYLRKAFRIQSVKTYSPFSEPDLNGSFSRNYKNTIFITATPQNALKLVSKKVTINTTQKKIIASGSFLGVLPVNGNYVFWINAKNENEFRQLTDKLAKKILLPKTPTFESINEAHL